MREVEVKARITNKDKVYNVLAERGCVFADPVEQHDVIFLRVGKKLGEVQPGDPVLRIRTQKDAVKLTYKEHVTNQLDCIEEELTVSDANSIRHIIERLGFVEVSQVHKVRTTTTYKDYELCLDVVEGLGAFIEVEKVVPDDEAVGLQDELHAFLFELGFNESDIVTDGYDIMLHKQGLTSNK